MKAKEPLLTGNIPLPDLSNFTDDISSIPNQDESKNNSTTFNWHQISINKKLGQGSYGSVYEGTYKQSELCNGISTPIEKRVAVKFFPLDPSASFYLEKNLNEKIFSKTSPINNDCDDRKCIAKYYGNSQIKDKKCLIFELGDHDLETELKEEKNYFFISKCPTVLTKIITKYIENIKNKLYEQKALQLAQVATGLHNLHIKNIIHRDIKPQNIVLDKDSNAKIIDLGSAIETETIPNLYHATISNFYCAPIEIFQLLEEALGKTKDKKTFEQFLLNENVLKEPINSAAYEKLNILNKMKKILSVDSNKDRIKKKYSNLHMIF